MDCDVNVDAALEEAVLTGRVTVYGTISLHPALALPVPMTKLLAMIPLPL
jgi:hypothetical protein